jgi:polysaccharide export outer membrane protein
MKSLVMAFWLMVTLSLALPAAEDQPADPAAAELPEDYVIGLEDILSVNVWKEPELSVKEVVVRPDGKISVPLVGDIQASGLTPMQLQERITERMKEYVAAPSVTIVVLRVGSRSVSIVGQVAKPGIYYLGAPMTVLELLARAGGIGPDAEEKKIAIVRTEGGKTVSYRFNYKDVSKGKHLEQNIELKNGDTVIVP